MKPPKIDLAALLAARKAAKTKQTYDEVAVKPLLPDMVSATHVMDLKTNADREPKLLPKLDLSSLRSKLNALKNNPNIVSSPILKNPEEIAIEKEVTKAPTVTGMSGEEITYNSEQQEAIDLAEAGESFVLIGAAGTGKTTCSQGATRALISSNKIPILQSEGHKHLLSGTPGIIIISYTRRAVNNIRKVQSEDLKSNCITAHKLLEYQPEYFEIEDPITKEIRRSMRFIPSRDALNPLSNTIYTIVVEEGSMLSVDLFNELNAATPHDIQWIFIGDIQQLPPVFGPAILGFKMLELPVVELTTVYRQALESPIIRLAHRILSGKPIPLTEYESWKYPGQLTIHPWKKKLSEDNATATLNRFFSIAIESGAYDPDNDMILLPFNKGVGTLEMNRYIANYLAKKREAIVHEIMAGFIKHYLAAGDRILYDREDAEIVSIEPNPAYNGASVQPPSIHLDYWGFNPKLAEEVASSEDSYDFDNIDELLAMSVASEDRVTQASHKIVVRLLDSSSEVTISKAADVNALLHSYCLTVHKAQGSEWRRVFLILHSTHATMLQRELLYTAVTRAREELYVICEPESFTKGIESQRIKGDTWQEKAEVFKGKLDKLDK